MLLAVVVALLLLSTAAALSCSSYEHEVTDWLNSENVKWRKVKFPARHDTDGSAPRHLLELSTSSDRPPVLLHLLPSPDSIDESASPTLTKEMTESSTQPIIHLHQDVFRAKPEIVRSRLLMRLGRTRFRVFARKTLARRINANVARDFLEEHHLWSSTRAKHNYGLFVVDRNEEEELVAVATFSKRRTVVRGGIPHYSHELLRFCTQRDGTVVGGITKLVKAFCVDQNPDDIVTVVDRDWGPGAGWHSLGFETVHVMSPLVMVVGEDGVRRHLVGAGIQNGSNAKSAGRLGLSSEVLGELSSITDAAQALTCVVRHGFYPVYDTGVERLMMLLPNSEAANKRGDGESALELWKESLPTYTSSYYSNNSGIAALLKSVESIDSSVETREGPLDSSEALASVASWRATAGTAQSAKLVFSAPSSLDPNATVEVRERPGGWCTVGIVGGSTPSIYHGIYKLDNHGSIDATAVVSEHLRTMASFAFAALELRTNLDDSLRFLYLGLGAGTLSRLMNHYIPDSEHVAVELDRGVAAAAKSLFVQPNLFIEVVDALEYRRPESEPPFDCVFVDIFDGNNLLPAVFYSTQFVERLRDDILGPTGIIVHNFHSGNYKLASQLEVAKAGFGSAFEICCEADSLDSKPNGGNTIVLASKLAVNGAVGQALSAAALRARQRWGLAFDASWRVKGAQDVRG